MEHENLQSLTKENAADLIASRQWETLVSLGASAVEPLIQILRAEHAFPLDKVAEALGKIGDAHAVEPLIKTLENKKHYWTIRREAALALGEIGDHRAIKPLIEALNDRVVDARCYAVHALGKIGAVQAIRPLINVLEEKIRQEKSHYFPSKCRDIRTETIHALACIGTAALNDLLEALGEKYWAIRAEIAEILHEIAETYPVAPQASQTRKKTSFSRFYPGEIKEALVRIGTPVMEPLLRFLWNPQSELRKIAVDVLSKIGDERIVDPLINALNDENTWVRSDAALILGKIGESKAVMPLITTLEDRSSNVRLSAAVALGRFQDRRTIKPFIQRLADKNAFVRQRVAKNLANMGWKPENDMEQILYTVAQQDWDTLAKSGSSGLQSLLALLRDRDRHVRKQAADTLRAICASITTIIFGQGEIHPNDQEQTLWNPDITQLTLPMPVLRRVELHTATYDFHLVERFITYAVNYIGQRHLKKHVEVHIYGALKKLHPNLRNTFENLCKGVKVHEERT